MQGPECGEALSLSEDVDLISFTGSTRAGRRINEVSAQTIKRVRTELGGKSAAVLLDDADMEVSASSRAHRQIFRSR